MDWPNILKIKSQEESFFKNRGRIHRDLDSCVPGRREAEDEYEVLWAHAEIPLQSKCAQSDGTWMVRAVHKFLSVICYTELTTSLESTQSVSYLELPNPLFMWFSLSGMLSLRFSLSLLISTGINLLTLTSNAIFVFDPQAGSACNILLLSRATHHILSHRMRIWVHYFLTIR